MVFPSLLAIIIPIVVGLIFGVAGVMGLLAGGLGAGFVLAVFMANSGGAWDNAKKYVEEGHLNILIKLMSMVAIVMAGVTCMFSLL